MEVLTLEDFQENICEFSVICTSFQSFLKFLCNADFGEYVEELQIVRETKKRLCLSWSHVSLDRRLVCVLGFRVPQWLQSGLCVN